MHLMLISDTSFSRSSRVFWLQVSICLLDVTLQSAQTRNLEHRFSLGLYYLWVVWLNVVIWSVVRSSRECCFKFRPTVEKSRFPARILITFCHIDCCSSGWMKRCKSYGCYFSTVVNTLAVVQEVFRFKTCSLFG